MMPFRQVALLLPRLLRPILPIRSRTVPLRPPTVCSRTSCECGQGISGVLKKYPESVHVPNAIYWVGTAKFALKDYKGALGSYQKLLKISPATPKAAEVLLKIAGCQQELKQTAAANKTLKQLIAKYPTSEAAAEAKKLLADAN